MTQTMAFGSADEVIAELRRQGGRLSVPRRLVIEALFAAPEPISAEDLSQALRLELTSVYRTLERLEDLGVVHHVHFGHGAGLYVLRHPPAALEYFVCERCGGVTSVEASRLDGIREVIRSEFGFGPRFDHFPMFGICEACRSALSG